MFRFSNLSPPDPPLSPLSSRPGFPATLHQTGPLVRLSLKERRMRPVNATKFHRKSGGAQPSGSAVRPSQSRKPRLPLSRCYCSPRLSPALPRLRSGSQKGESGKKRVIDKSGRVEDQKNDWRDRADARPPRQFRDRRPSVTGAGHKSVSDQAMPARSATESKTRRQKPLGQGFPGPTKSFLEWRVACTPIGYADKWQ
jgi:hypothetical protein